MDARGYKETIHVDTRAMKETILWGNIYMVCNKKTKPKPLTNPMLNKSK